MTSDPAKHAEAVRREAEHLQRVFYEDGYLPAGETATKLFEAAAYLASLPSDDNEPATVEWLETQGWINRGEYLEFNTENISLDFWPQYKLLKAQGSTLIDNPIRSAVRHLLAALTPLTPATGGEG